MATDFDEESYGQRWQSETVMFMLKQHQGEALSARKYHTRRREMALRCITHNVMIVYVWAAFLQGIPDTFSAPRSARNWAYGLSHYCDSTPDPLPPTPYRSSTPDPFSSPFFFSPCSITSADVTSIIPANSPVIGETH